MSPFQCVICHISTKTMYIEFKCPQGTSMTSQQVGVKLSVLSKVGCIKKQHMREHQRKPRIPVFQV